MPIFISTSASRLAVAIAAISNEGPIDRILPKKIVGQKKDQIVWFHYPGKLRPGKPASKSLICPESNVPPILPVRLTMASILVLIPNYFAEIFQKSAEENTHCWPVKWSQLSAEQWFQSQQRQKL